MKYSITLLLLVLLSACQKENFEVVQEETESSFILDTELTSMISSVTSHDGSFDDIVDQSTCFSINFPYEVIQQDKVITINNVEDLNLIDPYYPVTPNFPITLSFATYETMEVSSEGLFNQYIAACANGELYNDRIVCVDFEYPISVSIYEPQTQNFETLVFNHDKDVFTGVKEISPNALASLQFPITIWYYDGTSKTIVDSEDLKQSILRVIAVCN